MILSAAISSTNDVTAALKTAKTNAEEQAKPAAPVKQLKSQRHIDHDEIEADLNVPKSMQDFIYKKMAKKIADSIEFVETVPKKEKKRKQNGNATNECCVRLLKDTDPITKIEVELDVPLESNKRPKLKIKRREVEADVYSHEEKIKMAAIDAERILQQTDTKGWKSKKPKSHKLFEYRAKKSVLNLVEPTNEFSALRKKNEWNESKIANSPWKTH